MTPPSGDERAAFEAWARSEKLDTHRRKHFDEYTMPSTQAAWLSWQARAKHTSGPHSPAPGLSEEERVSIQNAIVLLGEHMYERTANELDAIIDRLTGDQR